MATEKGTATGGDLLRRLETLVGAATEEIASLRTSNQELEQRVGELEQKLDEGQGALSQWSEQREEVETRLEGLVKGLEELLPS